MSVIHVLCSCHWSLVPPWLGCPHVGGGAGAVSAHQPIPEGSLVPLFSTGCWRLGETEGLRCPCALSLSPQPPHPEWLPWGQPLFGDALSPGGDVGELRSWKQLLHPCNYCCIPLPTSQGKFSKLSIPSACAGAVSKT